MNESIQRTVLSVLPGRAALLAASSVLLASCGLIPRMPIQMARFVQTEAYEQVFVASATSAETAASATPTVCDEDANIYLDSVFLRLVGPRNWSNLSSVYGLAEMCDELINGEIPLHGSISFAVYLLPNNHEQFQIEGSGHYFLIRKNDDDKIMMSGDFQIMPGIHSLDDLRAGYLDISIQLITTKVLLEDTFLHESDLRYRIFIDTRLSHKNVYAIDYQRKHEAYLGEDLFGRITIADSGQDSKLLDFRGTGFLHSDYGR